MLLPAGGMEIDPTGARKTELRVRKAQEITHGIGLKGCDDDMRDLVDGQTNGGERSVEFLAGPNLKHMLIGEVGIFLRERGGIWAAIDEHDMLAGANDESDQLQLVIRRLTVHPENLPARRPFPPAETNGVDPIHVGHQLPLSFTSGSLLSGAQ